MWCILVFFSFVHCTRGFLIRQPLSISFRTQLKDLKNVGEPLFLTPLLEKGNILEAQNQSLVKLQQLEDIKSFSGYFTVNKTCESNLFFWLFQAEKDWEEAPVVLWLQGGPGVSSMYGLLEELGPITSEGKLREYSWHKKVNLLFIDQPVGTGYSFTKKKCFAKNEVDVRNDLYPALVQFFQLFPVLQKNKFFLAGESYAGHYVPSVGYAIHKNNPCAKIKINLRGLLIGNGLMDYFYQSGYGSYLYQHGLIDDNGKQNIEDYESNMLAYIMQGDWERAWDSTNYQFGSIEKHIGNVSVYNFLDPNADSETDLEPTQDFLSSKAVRTALHVGKTDFQVYNYQDVYLNLHLDMVQSVKPEVEELLEHYPVVFYYGQLDIICAYPLAVNLLRNLDWSGAGEYLEAERRQWCVQDQVAGYWKSARNLHEVLVRDAGHMVPSDQPLWALQLLDSVTSSPAANPLQSLTACSNSV